MTKIKYYLDDDFFQKSEDTGIISKDDYSQLTFEELGGDSYLELMIRAYRQLILTCINWDNPGDEAWGKQFTPNYFKLIRELREEIVLYMQKKGFDIL
jgi:hypothetical protein